MTGGSVYSDFQGSLVQRVLHLIFLSWAWADEESFFHKPWEKDGKRTLPHRQGPHNVCEVII